MTSYGIAKLANVWHAKALARRLADSGVCAVSLHPGAVSTDIGRNVCCGTCCFKCAVVVVAVQRDVVVKHEH